MTYVVTNPNSPGFAGSVQGTLQSEIDLLDTRTSSFSSAETWGASPSASATVNTAAFNSAAAAAADTGVLTAPAGTYQLNGTITLPSGVTFRAPGVILQQTAGNTPIIKASSATDIAIDGVDFVGVGRTDSGASTANSAFWSQTPTNQAYAMWFDNCQRVRLKNFKATNLRGAAVRFWRPTDIWVDDYTVAGTYDGGVLETGLPPADANYSQFGILVFSDGHGASVVGDNINIGAGNITAVAHAVFVSPGFTRVTVRGPRWSNLQQHGFYVYPTQKLVIDDVQGDSLTGCKVQSIPSNTPFTPTDIVINNFLLTSDSAPALMVELADEYAGSTPVRSSNYISNVKVTDGVVSATNHAGLFLSGVRDVDAVNVTARDCARSGIYTWNTSGRITNPRVLRCGSDTNYSPITINAAAYQVVEVVEPTIIGIQSGTPLAYVTTAWDATYSPPIAWVTAKFYGARTYTTNSGNIYYTAAGGTTGATGPTHGAGSASDGGVTWLYIAAVASVDKGTLILRGGTVTPGATEPTSALYLAGTNIVLRGVDLSATPLTINTSGLISLVEDGTTRHNGWTGGNPYSSTVYQGRPRRDFAISSTPSSGTFERGDRGWFRNPGPFAFETATAAGTPGTWWPVQTQARATASPTNGGSVTPDTAAANTFVYTAGAGVASFTINAPSATRTGQRIAVMVRNNSGGACAVTWNAAFKKTWTDPATGNSRTAIFEYDGASWIQLRADADIPN